VEADGDSAKTQARYIKYRVEELVAADLKNQETSQAWVCDACKHENFEGIPHCLSCFKTRPKKEGGAIPADSVEPAKQPVKKFDTSRPWVCDNCQHENFESLKSCLNCYKPRPRQYGEWRNNDPLPTNQTTTVHPWRRYFARMFDLSLMAFPIIMAMSLLIPFKPYSQVTLKSGLKSYGNLLNIISLPIWLIVESWLIATFKTTPGKWMWGITITDVEGQKLSFSRALKRSIGVWTDGMWLGIPLFSAIAAALNHERLKKNHTTSWDKAGNIQYRHDEITLFKVLLIILCFIAISFLMSFGNL